MAVLSNHRHEAFAQAVAKGKSAAEAMREAGYGDTRNSTRLTKNDDIQRRVDELQQMAAQQIVVTREWVLTKLYENAANNQATNPNASNKALELLGKELGMFVDRTENINHNYHIEDEPMSVEDWSDKYAAH